MRTKELLGAVLLSLFLISFSNYMLNTKVVATGTIECSIIEGPQQHALVGTLVVADCGLRFSRYVNISTTDPAQRASFAPGKSFTCAYEDRYQPLLPFVGSAASNTQRHTRGPCAREAYYLRNTTS